MHALRFPEPLEHESETGLRRAIDAMLCMAGATAGSRVLDVTAATLDVDEGAFDVAVCRFGLVFFPDPLQVLRDVHRALRPGGGVCTMVLAHAGCSLGRPGRIDALFKAAGFRDVATTAIDAAFGWSSATRLTADGNEPSELLLTAGRRR